MIDIKKINGNEILDFMNKERRTDEWCDVSIRGPFEFVSQKIYGNTYKLYFMGYYNNWGRDQEMEDNCIMIYPDGSVRVNLDEPFEGDGSSQTIEESLVKWLETHVFSENSSLDFNLLITNASYDLKKISYANSDGLDSIIENLIKAKTYLK